jgi:S-adenosylmethionine:tRNA ribosyltransferase-isomerase
MRTDDFDFRLPKSLIASRPAAKRDSSRLLVLHKGGRIEHGGFHDLIEHLLPGDMLLLNRTKVLPMSLSGTKPGGGSMDLLLVRNISHNKWEILSTGGFTGELHISERLRAHIREGKTAELKFEGDLGDILWECGRMPLPPYIKRKADRTDKERYQTVYARDEGSIAAPTAGLHFTKELLRRIALKGVLIRYLTLHVGKGTFIPVRTERVGEHVMEPEHFQIDTRLVEEISTLRGRLLAVGTTTTRAIEGLLSGIHSQLISMNGILAGSTDMFIYPGHEFRAVTGLLTNFHLPRSTPLMLTAALAGRENLLRAYSAATGLNYRFFSYGDAMLIP